MAHAYTADVRFAQLHAWNLTPTEAIALQRELAPRVVREGEPRGVRLIAAADVAGLGREWPRQPSRGRAAAVVMSWPELAVVESAVIEDDFRFPYVPGLLSFREIPLLARVFERIHSTPDLLLVDGQGISHPRRLGIAAHVGLLADVPTIGCAKSRLCGEHPDLAPRRGAAVDLHDHAELVGRVVRTREGVKPLYVSVGNNISLEASVDWVLRLATRFRLPEPIRIADALSKGR
ncbi:MAG TPA: deoxyribonuclease V [Dehalococcoidia bacterium]|nr:deoxyribonuclease V [Dehalococcoidia bacterium]